MRRLLALYVLNVRVDVSSALLSPLFTTALARPYGKNSCVQVGWRQWGWRLSVSRLSVWRRSVWCLSMYDHVRKGSGFFHVNCYAVGAGELVIWCGWTSTQKLYFKFGGLVGIVCEYHLLVRLDLD